MATPAAPGPRRLTSYPVPQAEALAWHLHEDLRALLDERQIELADLLDIPPGDWRCSPGDLVELLCDDVGHLLRASMAGAVHLLLHAPPAVAGGRVHQALLHATYRTAPERVPPPGGARRRGGLLGPGLLPAGEIAILVDWDRDAGRARRERLSPPTYNLGWTPPPDRCDPTTLVRDRGGSLAATAARIVRRDGPASAASAAAAGDLTFVDVP